MRFLTFTRLQQAGIIVLSCTALLASGITICQSMAEKNGVKGVKGVKGADVRFIPEDIGKNTGTYTVNNEVFQRININTASQEELMSLPKVGFCTAARIIEYRKRHGRFSCPKELLNVKGIGPKTLVKIQDGICVGTGSIKAGSMSIAATKSVKTTTWVGVKPTPTTVIKKVSVNINTASASELESLPCIGPGKAKAILDYRNSHGLFQTIEDITMVKGIGEKILERIKSLITVGEKTQENHVPPDIIGTTNEHE